MQRVAKILSEALVENKFSINMCELKEGFLTERFEIRFVKKTGITKYKSLKQLLNILVLSITIMNLRN